MARVLGLDPGTARCGVAVSDSRETMAFPRPALVVTERLILNIADVVTEEGAELVVVGRPLSLSGDVTSSTEMADQLFHQLVTTLSVEVRQWDERLTTVEASRSMSAAGRNTREQRDRIDSAAAVVLLTSFMDARRHD